MKKIIVLIICIIFLTSLVTAEVINQKKSGPSFDLKLECFDSDTDMVQKAKRIQWPSFQVKGNINGSYAGSNTPGTWEDYCKSDKELVEYSCGESGYIIFKTIVCPNGCLDGACAQPPFCLDTDKGKKTFISGIIYYIESEEKAEKKEDYCEGNTLHEFSCLTELVDGVGLKEETIECANGCQDKKCNLNVQTLEESQEKVVAGTQGITLKQGEEQMIQSKKTMLNSVTMVTNQVTNEILVEESIQNAKHQDSISLGESIYLVEIEDGIVYLSEVPTLMNFQNGLGIDGQEESKEPENTGGFFSNFFGFFGFGGGADEQTEPENNLGPSLGSQQQGPSVGSTQTGSQSLFSVETSNTPSTPQTGSVGTVGLITPPTGQSNTQGSAPSTNTFSFSF